LRNGKSRIAGAPKPATSSPRSIPGLPKASTPPTWRRPRRYSISWRELLIRDPEARYFGGRVEELSLVPLGEARLGRIGLDEWLRRSQTKAWSCIRQPKDRGSMKRILWSLLVATLPFGSVLADAPKEKNAKVTLVYQHELPNVPGKSIKGVLVE
jgi:hypothetical protein